MTAALPTLAHPATDSRNSGRSLVSALDASRVFGHMRQARRADGRVYVCQIVCEIEGLPRPLPAGCVIVEGRRRCFIGRWPSLADFLINRPDLAQGDWGPA